MDDNSKLPKQAKPQEFELVELLFQEYIQHNIAIPNIEYSFQARFQSFINQIPSYLHSSNKPGFFTHFFFGSFATLLDTELSNKIGINKLHYYFDKANILRIVAETDGKTHVFIFAENSSKNTKQQQNKNKDLEFTKGEWKILKGREYTADDKDNLEISVIKVNKSKGSIKVTVEKQDIEDVIDSTKQYHAVIRQCIDKDGYHIYLEDKINILSYSKSQDIEKSLIIILEYIKKIHDYYQGLPYGDMAQEADEHGFVAGIFNNFRYRENAHVYLEQFAGRGYADIVLLVRGAERSTKSIPIIIELKAGSGSGTTSSEALVQVTEYSKGFQPNNMRILTIPDNILCVGMNLDHDANSFMQMKLVQRDQEMIPLMQGIIDAVKKSKVNNNDVITQEIKHQLENTYQTFPGVGEKSSAHYFSRFLLGESIVLQDYHKHIFVYDADEYIATRTIIDQHATRSKDGVATKKQGVEKVVDSSNAVTTILLISKDQDDPAILLNIVDANRKIVVKNVELNGDLIGNRKIISLDIKFNIDQSSEGFKKYCAVQIGKVYGSISEYTNENTIKATGDFSKISFKNSIDLAGQIKNAIDSQRDLIIAESKYQELFKKLEEILYPLKSLVNNEAEFQGILEGVFKYYSDIKLNERSDRRELVLTEFQTGGGGRIDMLIQAIGASERGTKEYMPVGFELKYDDSVKLSSFDQQQDEYIQRLILGHKEKVLVNKLLNEQAERYLQGAVIKAITDSNKVAIMGIVFNARAKDAGDLLLTTDKFLTANIVHSSKLYSVSSNVNAINAQDSLKSDAEYFRPDWVEQETYDVLAKARVDDDSILYLSNSVLNDQTVKRLGDLLKSEVQIGQYIDGLDLSFNTVTASSVQELIKKFSKLVYLDLSDNDLGNNHIIDLEEIIKDIQVPILKIADIGMNDEQMGKIFKSLAENDKISDLDITHLEDDNNLIMSQDTASKIAQYLKSTRMLNYLNIAHNKIDDVAMSIIAQGLKGQSTLSSLVLTENSIGTQGTKALGEVLKDTTISNIDLSGNPLGILGVQAIVAGLKDADNIESIVLVNVALKYNRYDRDTSRKLLSSISSLFQNQHLTKINIAENNIGNGALSKIFRILSTRGEKSNLQDLSLAGNTIDWGAHQATINTLKSYMYNFISTNKKIRSLDLAFMSIDDDIGERIASALEENVSLVHLDLGGNDGIGSKTVNSLANVLKTHQYLKYLNLSDNKLSITDIRLILEAMRMNQVVSHINLSGNDFSGIITDVDGKKIIDLNNQYVDFEKLLSGNRELKYLNLANCKLNKQSILSLCKAIENNIAIEVLDIRNNEIESSIVDSVIESLNKNANQGLDIGLKILHVSKGDLEGNAISKLTDKSLGIAVLVDGVDVLNVSAEERLKQTSCTINALDEQSVGALDRDQQTFEGNTISGKYHYWLQAHDISDIARVHYGYGEARPIEIVGSIGQLSTQIDQYRTNNNNAKPLTMILNIGADGVGGDHWVSLVLHNIGNEYQGYYVDSLGNNIAGNVASILSQYRIMIHDLSNQQQRDGHNCGLWALENGQRISEFLSNNGEIGNTDVNSISNSLVRSRSEEEFEEVRDNILRELINDNQRRVHLNNIGIAQVEVPQDYNDNYNLYGDGRQALEQCAMLAMIGGSIKMAKSKRSVTATDHRNDHKLLLDSQKFVDCAYDVKQEVISSQLTSLVHHFKVVGDNKSCKAIDKLIINQGIINKLNSIDKTIPIEILNIKNFGYNWSALHVAAQLGDIEEVEELIKQGIDVNVRANGGWRPLHLASQYASKEVVSLLIKSGAETDVVAKRGWTPLHLAAQSISVEVIDQLIINGVYVDGQTDNGWSPLHVAIQCANQDIVRALLKNKANINISNQEGWTAIYLAVLRNNIRMVKLLMEHKADITVMSQERNTPLHIAIKNDYKEITKYLIEEFRGDNNYTLLHLAVKSNNKALIDIIIKDGANINAVDNNGNTVLHLATAINNIGLVKYLIAHNVGVNIHDKEGNTALHLAVAMNNEEIVKYLIEHKANVNAVDKYGNAPLHLAVVVNNKEIVEYLIEHKANVNTSNDNGDSPISVGTKIVVGIGVTIGILFVIGKVCVISTKGIGSVIAMRGGYSIISGSDHEVLDRLVEHGASLNVQNDMGNTFLHESVQHNNYEMVEFWLNKGANIDVTNNIGNTPLHIATNNLRYRGRITRDAQDQNINDTITEKIISILVEQKANVISQNKVHDTPLHLAVRKNNNKIVKLFLKEVKNGDVLFSMPDNNGDTILSLAFKSNNSDMISCFTNFMDCTGNNILHLAILRNEEQVLSLLMQNKVDVNVVNQDGNTPLYLAVKSNNKEVIDILIKNGADIDAVNDNGDTSLHLAVFMNNEELVKYLIAYKANVNMQDNDGNTPLHLAMNLRNQEIMKYLIQHSANVSIKNKLDEFALQDVFVLKMFKNAVDNNGNSMLHHAVKDHDEKIVSLLLQEKVNIDIQNKEGNTALHVAAKEQDIKIFELLLQNRADINIKNIDGKTPIELGIKNGMEVYQLLYKYSIPVFTEQKDLNHPHRHHHGENYDGKGHNRENQEHILGNHRGRRDIEDELKIAKDYHDNIEVSVGNMEEISSSSASSDLKPIGYNMIKWIKDNIWKSINLNPIERIKNFLNVDDVKEKVKIHDLDVSDNVGCRNNHDQQNDLVNKLLIIRSTKAEIIALEERKIAEKKLLRALNQQLKIAEEECGYDEQEEYEEELSSSLLTLTKKRVDIQKQDSEVSQIAITKEINNEIERIKQSIQDNERLNYDYIHAIETVKAMALRGDITEFCYEDSMKYLAREIKDCEEEDIRLINALQELEKQQEEYYKLGSILGERSLRQIEALNIEEKKILQEEEKLASMYSSIQDQEQEIYRLKDQIKLRESKIESLQNKLNDNLATLDARDSNLSWHEALSYWNEIVDVETDTADQVSRRVNSSIHLTSLTSGFIGNNTYPDQVFDYTSFDVQGNLLLLNLLMSKKQVVKYNSQNVMMESREVDTEYAQSLAYNAYAPYRAENEESIELLYYNGLKNQDKIYEQFTW